MGFKGTVKLQQHSCRPIPACSRCGKPTMPPHHVKVSDPRGLRGGGGRGGGFHISLSFDIRALGAGMKRSFVHHKWFYEV